MSRRLRIQPTREGRRRIFFTYRHHSLQPPPLQRTARRGGRGCRIRWRCWALWRQHSTYWRAARGRPTTASKTSTSTRGPPRALSPATSIMPLFFKKEEAPTSRSFHVSIVPRRPHRYLPVSVGVPECCLACCKGRRDLYKS